MFKGRSRKQIPLYTRAGWLTAWIFIIAILAMALRTCIRAMDYSRKTRPAEIQHYKALGLEDGRVGRHIALPEEAKDNTLLRNAYNKGFREGRDKAFTGPKP